MIININILDNLNVLLFFLNGFKEYEKRYAINEKFNFFHGYY